MVLRYEVVGDGVGASDDVGIVALAIRRMPAVAHVQKMLLRQLGAQGAQHTQAAHAAVKNPDGHPGERQVQGVQAAVTAMFLNTPVAIFFCHSAGPVM